MDASKLIRDLNKRYLLVPHIDKYQKTGNFPPKWEINIHNYREDDGHFHPSMDCMPTIEELFLYKTGQRERASVNHLLRRAFDVGTFWHEYIESILVDMEFIAAENVERYCVKEITTKFSTFKAAGTGDLVGVNIPNAGDWLVDIKTMNKQSFLNPPISLMEKYKAQVNIYSDFFNKDKIMILAVCKDSPHEFKEIIVKKDQALIDDIYDKWSKVQLAIDCGELPEFA